MEAKDLMNGFIVNTPKGIGKVVRIFESGASVEIADEQLSFIYKYLSFVPLTRERLEKIGFEVQDQGGGREDIWMGFGPDCEGDIEFEFNNGVPTHLKIDGAFKGEYYTSNNIKYFHQLQLALTLCGIDKEIAL